MYLFILSQGVLDDRGVSYLTQKVPLCQEKARAWVRQPVRFPSEEPHFKLLLRSSLLRRETMLAQSSMDFLTQALALVPVGGSSARSVPTSASWREKASLSPSQPSLRSVPPLLGLRPATKGAIPLGIPAALLRKPATSLLFLSFRSFSLGSGCMVRSPYERRAGRDPRSGERGANRARFPRRGNRRVTSRHISRAYMDFLTGLSGDINLIPP